MSLGEEGRTPSFGSCYFQTMEFPSSRPARIINLFTDRMTNCELGQTHKSLLPIVSRWTYHELIFAIEREQVRCCHSWRRAWWTFGSCPSVKEKLESEGLREKENSRHTGPVRRIFSGQSRDGEAPPQSQELRCNRRPTRGCRYDMSFHSYDKSEGT